MIESNKICEILEGIDQDETYNACGWWETSFGATFGKERLKELLDYIELEKNDIGLKDINGKNIYADSSIVEFEWLIFRNHEPVVVNRLKGFFSKDKRLLNYKIMILENNTNYSLVYGLDYAFYNSSEARPKIINIKPLIWIFQ